MAAVLRFLVLSGLDFQSGQFVHIVAVPHQDRCIDVSFDAVSEGVEFLLSRHKLLEKHSVFVLGGTQNHVEPFGNILDGPPCILLDLLFRFLEAEQEQQLGFDRILDDQIQRLHLEVHTLEYALEDCVDNISQD